VKDDLKRLADAERRRVLDALPGVLGAVLPERVPEAYAPLCWDEVRLLHRSGVEFGGHTRTHPILSSISDPVQLRDEIVASRRRIENELQAEVPFFAYPNGKRGDLSDAVVQQVREAGFQAAVTTEGGINNHHSDPFQLKRLVMAPDAGERWFSESLALFRLRAKGLE
jgi:peptidoglycan/xylan/chitin deacetylase (PgdA/CDA1 family)